MSDSSPDSPPQPESPSSPDEVAAPRSDSVESNDQTDRLERLEELESRLDTLESRITAPGIALATVRDWVKKRQLWIRVDRWFLRHGTFFARCLVAVAFVWAAYFVFRAFGQFTDSEVHIQYTAVPLPPETTPEIELANDFLRAEVESTAAENQRLVNLLLWSVGGTVTVASIVIGLNWLATAKATDDERRRNEERLGGAENLLAMLADSLVQDLQVQVKRDLDRGNWGEAAHTISGRLEGENGNLLIKHREHLIRQVIEDIAQQAELANQPLGKATRADLIALTARCAYGDPIASKKLQSRIEGLEQYDKRSWDIDFEEDTPSEQG